MDHIHQYITASLELHLFFARIMKEHALFLEAGFTPANASCAQEADRLKVQLEDLLLQAVHLANGLIRPKVLCSGEIITEFTAKAEQQTQRLTGIAINKEITALEAALVNGGDICAGQEVMRQVRRLNQRALELVGRLIALKESIIAGVGACRMFTMNYPLLVKHILREARLYQSYLMRLEGGGAVDGLLYAPNGTILESDYDGARSVYPGSAGSHRGGAHQSLG